MPAKFSTYARLLKPMQKFYTKGDYTTYTVEKVEVTSVQDTSTAVLGDKVVGPMGTLVMVKVHVVGRKSPFIFTGTDRVELVTRPTTPTTE